MRYNSIQIGDFTLSLDTPIEELAALPDNILKKSKVSPNGDWTGVFCQTAEIGWAKAVIKVKLNGRKRVRGDRFDIQLSPVCGCIEEDPEYVDAFKKIEEVFQENGLSLRLKDRLKKYLFSPEEDYEFDRYNPGYTKRGLPSGGDGRRPESSTYEKINSILTPVFGEPREKHLPPFNEDWGHWASVYYYGGLEIRNCVISNPRTKSWQHEFFITKDVDDHENFPLKRRFPRKYTNFPTDMFPVPWD